MENRLPLPHPLLPAITGKLAAGLLAAALVVSGVAVYRYRAASNTASSSFTTSRVQRGTITDAVTGTGPIAASQAVPLNFKNSGKVAEIDVKVGDKVKAGQVLAKLDETDLRSQLDQAKANLANAQANYNKLVQGATPQAVASAQASVDSANTQLANAQRGLAGAHDVTAKDLAAQQQAVSDAQKSLQSIQAQIDQSTAADKVAVANATQALSDAQRTAQALPAVIAQQIESAKDKLYADQVADDAAVGRGSMTKEARQAALDADQVAIDQANASAQQQLAQSQQTLNQAQATLKTAQATLQNDLAKFQGQLVSAQTSLNQAQSNQANAQAKDNQSIQSAQSTLDSAAASLKTAQASYNSAVAAPSQAEIDASQAQVSAQQANVQLAQNNIDAAVLTAPTDGTVTAINGAVGQWLAGGSLNGSAAASASGASAGTSSSSNSSSNFISLTSLSGLQVTAQVNESDIGRVQVGQQATFTVDAFPNRTFTGKVAIIQPLGQTVQNVVSYTVTSTIDQTDAQLLPGMTATVNIIINRVSNALEVPMSALTYARAQAARQFAGGQGGGQAKPSGAVIRGGQSGAAAQGGQTGAGSQGGASAQAQQTGDQGQAAQASGAAQGAAGAAGAQGKPTGGQGGQGAQGGQGRAVQFEQPGGPGILYLLKDGKAQPVQVQFGPSDGRFVQVVSGVNEGDVVITGGGPTAATSSAAGVQTKPGGGGGVFFRGPGG